MGLYITHIISISQINQMKLMSMSSSLLSLWATNNYLHGSTFTTNTIHEFILLLVLCTTCASDVIMVN